MKKPIRVEKVTAKKGENEEKDDAKEKEKQEKQESLGRQGACKAHRPIWKQEEER